MSNTFTDALLACDFFQFVIDPLNENRLLDASGGIMLPQMSREREREHMMTLRNHVHSFFDRVHEEGRYRVFTDLERLL